MGRAATGRNIQPQWLSASSGPIRPRPTSAASSKPIALQILKTLARYAQTGEGSTKQLRGVGRPDPPARAGSPRLLPRHGDYFEISRVLDRKEAYR